MCLISLKCTLYWSSDEGFRKVWINEAFCFTGSRKYCLLRRRCKRTYCILAAGGFGGLSARESCGPKSRWSVERCCERGGRAAGRLQRTIASWDGGQKKIVDNVARLHLGTKTATSAGAKHLRSMIQRFIHIVVIYVLFVSIYINKYATIISYIQDYKEKLKKVCAVRSEVKSHISNLPDLTQLPDVTGGLAPLPSAGDLFSMH